MKQLYVFAFTLAVALLTAVPSVAQAPILKPRPDAFAPKDEPSMGKAIAMATTVGEMADWDRYPTYETYMAMMQGWASEFGTLCRLDTIGTSVQGRLLLCLVIDVPSSAKAAKPQFFYTSTMHGDEVTGFVMMLRLIDTLLHGYGSNEQYTDLLDNTLIFINPLANPDGTYAGGNQTVNLSQRYNANYVDLNRNFPDPFGSQPLNAQQPEVTAMIDYASAHQFRMSANLHGGSEVMNYPWDSFTSAQNPHPQSEWWKAVCRRFVDTLRSYSSSHFNDVTSTGYVAGGDWYVIPNGRQDYMNYYHNCLELTIEVSTVKKLSSSQLPEYWRFLQHSLVNYIAEVHNAPEVSTAVEAASEAEGLRAYPNPTRDRLLLSRAPQAELCLFNMQGQCVLRAEAGTQQLDLSALPQGVYLLRCGALQTKIVRQ